MPFRPRSNVSAPKRSAALTPVNTPVATQRARARRALQEIEKDRRGWLRHGIAALAITGLGLGVAGAVTMTGSATGSAAGLTTRTVPAVAGPANAVLGSRGDGVSRAGTRKPLTETADPGTDRSKPLDGTVDLASRRDAQKNAGTTATSTVDSAATKTAAARVKALRSDSARTRKLSAKLTRRGRTAATRGRSASRSGQGHASLPVAPGAFHLAARFGQVGAWARYHTGIDFAAPIGTPIHATDTAVVTNAGIGSASSWAGNYVVIRFADGRQMLFAHMSSVSVRVGQHVTGGQLIGHVGMTGRTFGPHTHVELYPAGVKPGDVYSAVDPAPWFRTHGLHV